MLIFQLSDSSQYPVAAQVVYRNKNGAYERLARSGEAKLAQRKKIHTDNI